MIYKSTIKPALDFLISLIALLLLSPIFLLITLLLTVANSGKPFYTQTRPGKNARLFKVIKFKTMNDKKDDMGFLLPPAKRITPIGRFIRSTSLDEIPQLLNVIKGDMSLIGPRPLLIDYLPLYNSFQNRRHEVNPGITGWAQVNGRNAINWKSKFEYDVYYVDNISFYLDIKIIILTVLKVLLHKDVNQSKDVIMHRFTGSDLD
jgi:undecaprenyl phosphate N,N'-diacetylbacillosamine 1-phosphate transferase